MTARKGLRRAASTLHLWCALRRWALAAWLATLAGAGQAHDIPADVRVQAFVRPQGQALEVLLRVPLAAMREVDVPVLGPGWLDLERAQPKLLEAAELWIVPNLSAWEEEAALPPPRIVQARLSLASDRSFTSLESALAHLRGPPVAPGTQLVWREQFVDVLLEWPIASAQSRFSLDARFARLGLRVSTALRFVPPQGAERAFELHGQRSFVRLDPRWHQAALGFLELGLEHILNGVDHLLFVLALVIPFRRFAPLLALVTAFTLAHSVTLVAASLGFGPAGPWFAPLVEVVIAASIVWVALENLLAPRMHWRLPLAFVFGLVHGFGFSAALQDNLQFAGAHLAASLLAFNLGVELGQVVVLLVAVPLLALLARAVPERALVIVLSALVAHTAWHWMLERAEVLAKFPLSTVDPAAAASALRWLLAALLVAWALHVALRRWGGRFDSSGPATGSGSGPP